MIKLSTRGDYAIKTIIYLLKNNTSLVKISEISTNQKLSESLLRRVVADMERNSIIETIKWRNWWVKLALPIEKISVYDVLNASWENMNISDCTWGLKCSNFDKCSTTKVLNNIQKWFNTLLKMQTLDKIIK